MSTPSQLDAASKCYCFNDAEFKRVVAYLLDQINSGGGGGTVQDMQVAWTPTNVKLGQEMSFVSDPAGSGGPVLSGITSLTFNQTTSVAGFDIESASASLTSVSFPNLITIDPTNLQGGGLAVSSNPGLTSVSLPLLTTVGGGNLSVSGNALLTSMSFPSLVSVAGIFSCSTNGLTSLSIPVFVPFNGQTILFNGNALPASQVNAILARCVANPAFVTGALALTGGAMAAPTGQGLIDKATLIGRGVNVTTN